jgi:hypothetical protein
LREEGWKRVGREWMGEREDAWEKDRKHESEHNM